MKRREQHLKETIIMPVRDVMWYIHNIPPHNYNGHIVYVPYCAMPCHTHITKDDQIALYDYSEIERDERDERGERRAEQTRVRGAGGGQLKTQTIKESPACILKL